MLKQVTENSQNGIKNWVLIGLIDSCLEACVFQQKLIKIHPLVE